MTSKSIGEIPAQVRSLGSLVDQGRGSRATASLSARAPAERPISASSAAALTAVAASSVTSIDGVGRTGRGLPGCGAGWGVGFVPRSVRVEAAAGLAAAGFFAARCLAAGFFAAGFVAAAAFAGFFGCDAGTFCAGAAVASVRGARLALRR